MSSSGTNPLDVVLVGYEDQEHLGLRSLAAYLHSQGYTAGILRFHPSWSDELLEWIRETDPGIVGFSLIFQHTLAEFLRFIRFLRENGITAHFTAGGHFPSLRPADTLDLIPELNSVVMFEGEFTLEELLRNLECPEKFHRIKGLAFRDGGRIIINEPRPLIDDLDALPFIYRNNREDVIAGNLMVYMIASRGCRHNCSFCSIRQFYGSVPGRLRRTRSPRSVAEEMDHHYRNRHVRYFSFRDDDFVSVSGSQREWVIHFLEEIRNKGLDRVCWGISCRVDGIDREILAQMKDHGLIYVSMGVESANITGLKVLNKQVSPEQNLRAIELLKQLDLGCSMGFMLFDPSSTLQTIRENIGFLRQVGEDGHFIINFCKMVPYAGTPIEKQLQSEGRLTGNLVSPDYHFTDPVTDWYAYIVRRIFLRRNHHPQGLVRLLQSTDYEYRAHVFLNMDKKEDDFKYGIRELTRKANRLAVGTLEELLKVSETYDIERLVHDKTIIPEIAEREWRGELEIESEFIEIRKQYAGKWNFFDIDKIYPEPVLQE